MNIILILLFWISILGYSILVSKKFNIKDELILGFVFIAISLITFINGLLNILKVGSLFLLLIGVGLFIYYIVKEKKNIFVLFKHMNINIKITIILLLYVTVFFSNLHITHYDNFTHWGLIIKNMLLYDKFPNFENPAIIFKGYQPGSACFIYYFTHLFKYNEGMMIVAQNYLLIAFLSPILMFVKTKKKLLLNILCIITIIFVSLSNVMPYDLLVDTLLSAILIFAIITIYTYKKDLKRLFYYSLILSLYLSLIKNTGYVFVCIICLLYLLNGIKQKKIKQGIFVSIIIGIATLALLYIWMSHVKYAYGYSALYSHHSLSANNIASHLRALGLPGIMKFIKIYLFNFVDFKNNFSVTIMIILNVILLSYFITLRNVNKKTIAFSIIGLNSLYIIYYLFLGLMYICSMEQDGLFTLVAFSRYIMTIIVPLIIIVILLFIKNYDNFKNSIIRALYVLIFITLMASYIFIHRNFSLDTIKFYVGKSDYNESYLSNLDKILTNDYVNMNSSRRVYLYAPSYKGSWGLVMYATRYKTNSSNVKTILKVEDLKDYEAGALLILLEEDDEISNYIKDNELCKISKGLYEKCGDINE